MSAFEIVMNDRKKLTESIIDSMKQGHTFTSTEWNHVALNPHNPLSGAKYKGGNRMRLMDQVIKHGYKDPRWMTAKQLNNNGYKVAKGERGTLCEKWIFEKKKTIRNADGDKEYITEPLKKPVVSFFKVFNAEQVVDFPELPEKEATEVFQITDDFIAASECEIKEIGQPDAFYSVSEDMICLPLRSYFKDDISFVKTTLHEMAHSTGHPDRLNREMGGAFGSEQYAVEELKAELGALFTEADMGIVLEGEHFQDHSNYLLSWIKVLEEDYNELFRACADAEKISQRLCMNYEEYIKQRALTNDIVHATERG